MDYLLKKSVIGFCLIKSKTQTMKQFFTKEHVFSSTSYSSITSTFV